MAVLSVAAVAGCSSTTGTIVASSTKLKDLPADSPAVTSMADAVRQFAWQLIADGKEPNRLISPSSFALALGMLGEGATGATAKAIDDAFGFTGDERSAALGGWKQSLKAYDQLPDKVDVENPPDEPVAHLAAQVVVVKRVDVQQEFVDRLAGYYDAHAVTVDSVNALKPVLDAFARRETAGLIKESGIAIDGQLRLVIQDAVLLVVRWGSEFAEGKLDFQTPSGPKNVDSLTNTLRARAVETAGARAARIPCTERFFMDVILPDGDATAFTADMLQEVTTKLDASPTRDVEIQMPASDQQAKLNFREVLASTEILPGNYDDIFAGAMLDQFVQQARLIVTKRGVIGAALTEGGLAVSGRAEPIEPFKLVVNRPYILQVIDEAHGWPLFLALVTDPTQK